MTQYLSSLFVVGVLTFSLFGQLYAQPTESTSKLQDRVDRLEGELHELKALLKEQVQKDSERETELKSLKEQTEKQQKMISKATREFKEAEEMVVAPPELYWGIKAQEFYDTGLSPHFSNQSVKPFLRNLGKNTFIGGYMDIEYRAVEGENNGFDQHRILPFIYADLSERVKFSSEIEFEHGGPQNNKKDGAVKIEFATIDFLIREEINLRGGMILSPLGKFNLVHDSPLQDLTDRPLVDRHIIPTTLSEAGAGLFGTFYLSELSRLDYEIYAVNGFEGLTREGEALFDTSDGVRNGRGSQRSDFNGDPAVVGRLGYSPFLGLQVGGSFHHGAYDERNDNDLTIVAFDMAYQKGPFEVVGEFANAFIERDSFARSAFIIDKDDKGIPSPIPDDMWGYYIEPKYHFMPEFLRAIAPKIFTVDSTFTAVARWGQLDLDGSVSNRATFGLNYRYTEDTVFKLDYQINTEHGDKSSKNNNAFLFSMATYF